MTHSSKRLYDKTDLAEQASASICSRDRTTLYRSWKTDNTPHCSLIQSSLTREHRRIYLSFVMSESRVTGDYFTRKSNTVTKASSAQNYGLLCPVMCSYLLPPTKMMLSKIKGPCLGWQHEINQNGKHFVECGFGGLCDVSVRPTNFSNKRPSRPNNWRKNHW
jgi:hypothetical protein